MAKKTETFDEKSFVTSDLRDDHIQAPPDAPLDARAEDVIETPGSRPGTLDDELALKLYLAYGASLGYKTLKGEALGPWEDLHKAEQDAWRNAAFAARTHGR